MANFKSHRNCDVALLGFAAGLLVLGAWPSSADAQQTVAGFGLERFYPSAPGAGWFVMDDLNIGGGLGGAIQLTSGYARNPLVLPAADGTPRFALVSTEAFVDVGAAVTYERYRVYVNFPVPYFVAGNTGMIGSYQLT